MSRGWKSRTPASWRTWKSWTPKKTAALALIAQLEAARAKDAGSIAELERQRKEREALIESLDSDKAAALALVETFKSSLSAEQAALADLESRTDQTEAERAELERQLAERRADLERLQTENADRLKAFENLSAEQALALATIAKLESERETEAERATRLAAERDLLAQDVETASAKADEFQFDLKNALDRAADLSSRLTAAEEAKLADAAAAQALREQLAKSEAELDTLTLALDAARKDAEETLTLLAAAEASRDQLSEDALTAADQVDREAALRALAESELASAKSQTLEEQRKVAALTAQVRELNTQLGTLQTLLDEAGERDEKSKVQIAQLGSKLNQALAQKVSELSRFRSEFFGKMRDVLGGREGIQVVGDRFVFQSEILFGSASAILGPDGQRELSKLAEVVRELSRAAPAELNWILRIDGHTDSVPLRGGRYSDNWELSPGTGPVSCSLHGQSGRHSTEPAGCDRLRSVSADRSRKQPGGQCQEPADRVQVHRTLRVIPRPGCRSSLPTAAPRNPHRDRRVPAVPRGRPVRRSGPRASPRSGPCG